MSRRIRFADGTVAGYTVADLERAALRIWGEQEDDQRLAFARDITDEATVIEHDPRDVVLHYEGGRITKAVVLR